MWARIRLQCSVDNRKPMLVRRHGCLLSKSHLKKKSDDIFSRNEITQLGCGHRTQKFIFSEEMIYFIAVVLTSFP